MKFTLIVPPGQGGVRDFTDKLAERLTDSYKVQVIAWSQENEPDVLPQLVNADCVYLQYSGYGYAKRGTPLWLLKELQRNRKHIKQLGIFFHELYAFGPPWGSAFWLSPLQRHIARRLAELSDFWLSNREDSAHWLRQYAADKPQAVLPVFSNVGEMEVYNSRRQPKVIVFGGAPLREKTYRAAGDELFQWTKEQGLQIHDIGPTIADAELRRRLTQQGVIQHGRLDIKEISDLMMDAMFGVVTYPVEYVAKSGVFAAYCAHGICPLLISERYVPTDGLTENNQFLPYPALTKHASDSVKIGKAAWHWYSQHDLNKHANHLHAFLG